MFSSESAIISPLFGLQRTDNVVPLALIKLINQRTERPTRNPVYKALTLGGRNAAHDVFTHVGPARIMRQNQFAHSVARVPLEWGRHPSSVT